MPDVVAADTNEVANSCAQAPEYELSVAPSDMANRPDANR